MIVLDGVSVDCEQLHAVGHGAASCLGEVARQSMTANAGQVPPGRSVLEAKRDALVGPASKDLGPDELTRAFVRGHCAGVGPLLDPVLVRATMAARVNVLAGSLTGCRPQAADVLLRALEQNDVPEVPSQGSVGAAGDLAPLAHIVWETFGFEGEPDFFPTPKEALALINGCSMTAALGAVAVVRAQRVLEAAIATTAMTMEVVRADAGALDARPLKARGHPGAQQVAASLRELLEGSERVQPDRRPDAFSIRCSATVLGAVKEALDQTRATIERELNGAGDNPLLFDGSWVEAGNFHGAPLALVLDHLKVAMVHIATLSERRTFRLTYGQLSRGLPSFLVPGTGLNSGFMLAQYTAASLCSECKGLAHPASVDVIPTVQHHEDHVSMGPIAGRAALRIIDCVADIVAIEAVLAAQALDLRKRGLHWDSEGQPIEVAPATLAPRIEDLLGVVRSKVPYWEDDGVLHPVLEAAGQLVRGGALSASRGPW